MLKSSGAVAGATMTSRILGLIREMVLARFMGAGWVADAFTFAFMVPNLFRRLLGEGALTAAFIPIFKETEKQSGDKVMWQSANAVVCGLVVVTCGLVMLAAAGLTVVLGVSGLDGKTKLMLELLRLMFPYVALVCVAALFTGMLNARGRFFVPALGSALLNIVLIAAVLLLAPRMGLELHEQIVGLAIGVLAAGVVQAVFQWPLLHNEGFRLRWASPFGNPTVRRVIVRMIPGIVGVAAYQINVLVTNGVAFWVDDALVATFNYAIRLMELPQGVIGLSLATYLLPTLAGLATDKNYGAFRSTLQSGMGYLTVTNLLASVLLLLLAEPIIRLLFERGRFDSHDTARSALALMCLAPGLIAFSTVNILGRAFYALGDVRTPVRISVFCLGLNVVLVLILIIPLKEVGLGLANSTTALINMGLLIFALRRKIARLDWGELTRSLPGLFGAVLLAGLAAWFLRRFWTGQLGNETFWLRMGEVFVPILGATVLYAAVGLWLKVPYMHDFLALFRGKRPGKQG